MNTFHHTKTKIVATIGPASETEETMEQLLRAGANVFRFNMKHGTVEWHEERIARLQQVADRMGQPIGILIDLQGPEIRVETPNKEPLPLAKDEVVLMSVELVEGKKSIAVKDQRVIDALGVGDQALIDDGAIDLEVVEKVPEGVMVRSRGNYQVGHRKGMNLPGVKLDLHSLIDADLQKLDLATRHHIDIVALSFVRSADDLRILREEMAKRKIEAMVCAKIENAHALENIDAIIASADCVMVARGDLGIEVPYEELAYWQKRLILKCRQEGKPVITATQMLQSMIEAPRPTRAEVTDVANAIFDGSDATMLSGETAQGKYPVEAVTTMRRIATFNEEKALLPPLSTNHPLDQTESVTRAAFALMDAQREFTIAAVVVFTETGKTVRMISRFRPDLPVIAVTESTNIQDQLCLCYGVTPFAMDFPEGEVSNLDPIMSKLKEQGMVSAGDRLLFIHGHHWRQPGLTNTLTIKEVV